MKCPLGISNFLEEISSLSHSVVFLHFFAVITEVAFLLCPCYSLELCIRMDLSFLCSLIFASFLFQLFVRHRNYDVFILVRFLSLLLTLLNSAWHIIGAQ